MALTNYTDLKASIADWLNRDDLTSVIPTFIALGEADVARDLRHWLQERRITATIDEEYEFLPSDWLETISLRLGSGDEIQLITQSEMADFKRNTSTQQGKPRFYVISAGQMEFYPVPDGTDTMILTYYARIPSLSDTNTTNWLITNHPDVLLYASLKHAAPYLDDVERIGVWTQLYQQAVSSLTIDGTKAKYSGPLVMRMKAG